MAEKNTGKPYVLLTIRIFNELLKQDQVETLRLEHDVILAYHKAVLLQCWFLKVIQAI